ncbi:MAG: hypothetical protein K0R61_2966 [Microvirga sp.]|nr:hypothetical protein [Microvirga sp.]
MAALAAAWAGCRCPRSHQPRRARYRDRDPFSASEFVGRALWLARFDLRSMLRCCC